MKRLLAFLAIVTVVMIIMAIMANTSNATIKSFNGYSIQKEVIVEKPATLVREMNHSSADFQMVEYTGSSSITNNCLGKPECKLSAANSETSEYTITLNKNDGVDFETVAYQAK